MGRVLLHDQKTGQDYVFDGEFSIGRAESCGLRLSDPAVAQVHAQIKCRNGDKWYISDCSRGGGIWMNNFQVPEQGSLGLRNDCEIRLGNTAFLFTADEEAVAAAVARLERAKNAAPAQRWERPEVRQERPQVRQEPPQVRQEPQAEQPQARQERRKERRPVKLSKDYIVALCILAACLIGVLCWCGINHVSGTTALKNQDYPAAITALKKDFLFRGGQLREAYRQAGEAAFAQEDYEGASQYFLQQGAEGHARWSDAVYEQGCQLLQAQQPEAAVEVLEQIADETRAMEQIGAAQLAMAQQLLEEQDYEGAIELASQIENTEYADVDAFLNTVYRSMAACQMEEAQFDQALESFANCKGDPVAETDRAILRQMVDKEYYQAAQAAADSLERGETGVSRELWQSCLDQFAGTLGVKDLDAVLMVHAAKQVLDGSVSADLDSLERRTEAAALTGEMITGRIHDKKASWTLDSLDDFCDSCGAAANGKIAIVYQHRDYPGEEEYANLQLDAMSVLPLEYYPSSLDEVEYVIVVDFDYETAGYYTHSTIGLQENATVETFRLPGMRRIHSSGRIYGLEPPSTITYTGNPPVWKSGGPPRFGEELYDALARLIS